MKQIAMVILALAAVFFGGCSLWGLSIFLANPAGAGFGGLLLFPIIGLGVCYGCIKAIKSLQDKD